MRPTSTCFKLSYRYTTMRTTHMSKVEPMNLLQSRVTI